MIGQPVNFTKQLLRHQLNAVSAMERMEISGCIELSNGVRETSLGFLCGFVGTGKKVSTLGLIKRDKMEWPVEFPFSVTRYAVSCNGMVVDKYVHRYNRFPFTLVVSADARAWKREMKDANIAFLEVASVPDIQKIMDVAHVQPHDVQNHNLNETPQIVLVHPKVYNTLVTTLEGVAWKRFIYDDPETTCIPNMKTVVAGFHWVLAYDIARVIHKRRSIRSAKHYLKVVTDFKVITNTGNNITPVSLDHCHHASKLVVPHIPDSDYTKPVATHLYAYETDAVLLDRVYTEDTILGVLDTLYENPSEESDHKCVVCLENVQTERVIRDKQCKCTFCPGCIVKWIGINPVCPMCRAPINRSSISRITHDISQVNLKGKEGVLVDVLKNTSVYKKEMMNENTLSCGGGCRYKKVRVVLTARSRKSLGDVLARCGCSDIMDHPDIVFTERLYATNDTNVKHFECIVIYDDHIDDVDRYIYKVNHVGVSTPVSIYVIHNE